MLTVRGVCYLVDGAEPGDVDRDLTVISRELHCNAVMLISNDPQRLVSCARRALELGLAVYLRPDATDLRPATMLNRLAAAATAAEALRVEHPHRVVLLVGSEFSHTVSGIVPGPRSFIRLRLVVRHRRILRRWLHHRLNALLARSVAVAREHFRGPVTYAAAGWEEVDWAVFDHVGVSFYRSARNRDGYRERVRALARDHGRPLLITEFGCGAFVGANDRGAGSFHAVNWFSDPPRIDGDLPRDESVQASYLRELIGLYDAEGARGCFVFAYAMPGYPRSQDPAADLDKAGFALVVDVDGVLVRKQAFQAVAECFSGMAGRPPCTP
ncbi:hypothetical protein [Kineococcus sp. SYSU DK001]|uniref:hypothetical protein n=1 Tax=Kineococcus sp. SYSU DK001 TaxID=3383122 RepID=UPI003D7EEA14